MLLLIINHSPAQPLGPMCTHSTVILEVRVTSVALDETGGLPLGGN